MNCGRVLSGVSVFLVAACGGCSTNTADVSPGPPAGVAQAAEVLDLADFPLIPGADEPQHQRLAGLTYQAPGGVKNAFDFQRKELVKRKWKELSGSTTTEQAASATFGRDGYSLSVMVFPAAMPGKVFVTLINHGNVRLDKLPLPPGAKPFFAGPVSALYVTEEPVEPTAEALRKLLEADGWQPYGTAGDVQFVKKNCIRLSARVSLAPAQQGKTVIDYSATLMSVDLPAPPETEGLQYADSNAQLFFDSSATQQDVVDFYRQTLGKTDWEATTEKPVQIDSKDMMIFRNPQMDMRTLQMTNVDRDRKSVV